MEGQCTNEESSRTNKQWIVFVHGFGSSDETWTSLRDALLSDERVIARFEIAPSFNYLSRLLRIPIYQRFPSISEIAGQLRDHLKRAAPSSDQGRGVDLTLVGHSMGGLVIQKYMEECLPPQRPVNYNAFVRSFCSRRPISALASFLDYGKSCRCSCRIRKSRRYASSARRPVTPTRRFGTRSSMPSIGETVAGLPIAFYCFWGDSDAVVPRASSRGYFLYGQCIPGDHNSILKMKRPTDQAASASEGKRYQEFVSVLLDPHGHSNVWEIERFTYAVKVSPRPSQEAIVARHGVVQREIQKSDNVAQVVHQVEFSAKNHCSDPYVLKYGTSRHGWIDPKQPPLPHHTPADKRAIYENSGNYVWYEVLPN